MAVYDYRNPPPPQPWFRNTRLQRQRPGYRSLPLFPFTFVTRSTGTDEDDEAGRLYGADAGHALAGGEIGVGELHAHDDLTWLKVEACRAWLRDSSQVLDRKLQFAAGVGPRTGWAFTSEVSRISGLHGGASGASSAAEIHVGPSATVPDGELVGTPTFDLLPAPITLEPHQSLIVSSEPLPLGPGETFFISFFWREFRG
ncbi:unnamed protein product [marine sediment metagenome]|uniref:Uncharacterized protein n=1 Tax=marine sediment metagenome TaxID=412755 RepID=X1C8A3_9ZZZZ